MITCFCDACKKDIDTSKVAMFTVQVNSFENYFSREYEVCTTCLEEWNLDMGDEIEEEDDGDSISDSEFEDFLNGEI
jgi:hypothetical protein